MKGWRERAADIFAKHGEIAAKKKSAPGPRPSDSRNIKKSDGAVVTKNVAPRTVVAGVPARTIKGL